nr:hypothetical protein [Deinococcus taeanensis]
MKLGAPILPAATLLGTPDVPGRASCGPMKVVVTEETHAGKFDGLPPALLCLNTSGVDSANWLQLMAAQNAPTHFTPNRAMLAADPIQLCFTSGTTSWPKLLAYPHASYPAKHLSTLYYLGLREGA